MSSQENINSDSSPDSPATNKATKDALFEPKPKPKVIRVLTVLAYVLSVSMAAILLSIYYIFMWDGRPHIGARTMDIEFRDSSSDSRMGPKFLKYKAPIKINDYVNKVDIIGDSSLLDEATYNATRNETLTFSQNNELNETDTVEKMSYKATNGVKMPSCDSPQWNTSSLMETSVKFAGDEAKDRLYEPKHKKKLVRVLTVIAYVFFVSLAAIMLSLYYVFLWNDHRKVSTKYVTSIPQSQQRYSSRNCGSVLAEMQQQFTAMESAEIKALSTAPTIDEHVTWIEDYEILDNFKKSSVLIKKLMNKYDYSY